MLEYAKLYEAKLKLEFAKIAFDERFMWMDGSSYRKPYSCDGEHWSKMEMVSLDKDKNIIGYLKYTIARDSRRATSVQVVNFRTFEDNKKDRHIITFGRDLDRFLRDIFEKFDYNGLEYSVFTENPIMKTYDKLTEKFGGREVGTFTKRYRLLDGKLHDVKYYEITKEDYFNKNGKEI